MELLLVGYFENQKLLFAGKVHQGLNPANRRALLKVLQPLRVEECPFANLPTSKTGHWGEGVTGEEWEIMYGFAPRQWPKSNSPNGRMVAS